LNENILYQKPFESLGLFLFQELKEEFLKNLSYYQNMIIPFILRQKIEKDINIHLLSNENSFEEKIPVNFFKFTFHKGIENTNYKELFKNKLFQKIINKEINLNSIKFETIKVIIENKNYYIAKREVSTVIAGLKFLSLIKKENININQHTYLINKNFTYSELINYVLDYFYYLDDNNLTKLNFNSIITQIKKIIRRKNENIVE